MSAGYPWRGLASLIFIILFNFSTFPSLHALSTRIPNQNAQATARANAFVATADNPSAIYYNPAGITQLEGENLLIGLHTISVDAQYRSPSGDKVNNRNLHFVPQLHFTTTMDNYPVSFGLGIYAPFGLGMDWPDDVSFRNAGIESELLFITANPVVAWKVTDTLSIATGLTLNQSDIRLLQGFPLIPGSEFEFKGDGFAVGANAGILWQPVEKWSFGLNYRSPLEIDYEGSTRVKSISPKASSNAKFDYPQQIIAGVSFRPTPKWNLEVNVDWTDWETVDTVSLETPSATIPIPLNWKSSFFYEFGVTRYFENGWQTSAGYFYSEESTREEYFTPLVPDTALQVLSAGISKRGERWSWALSYEYIWGSWRTINDSATDPTINGDYRLINHAVNSSLSFSF